jgi:thiol-disulfide isomerase/thioredoxin
MKTATLIIFFIILSIAHTHAQNNNLPAAKLTENSIVKDTIGTSYPPAIWKQLIQTGRYTIRPEQPEKENSAFIITRISDQEYEKRMAAIPKPKESNFFRTGNRFFFSKATTITGEKINPKDLAGKILVVNFWYLNCPPCVAEIPELNKLAVEYKDDSSVVFIAVALDQKWPLKEFLKTHPFAYKVIDDGRYITSQFNINAYPTNVVVGIDGLVYFHSSGYSFSSVQWIKKSVKELKEKAAPVVSAAAN